MAEQESRVAQTVTQILGGADPAPVVATAPERKAAASWWREHQRLVVLVAAFSVLVGAEGVAWRHFHEKANMAHRRLLQLRRDRLELTRAQPALTSENLHAMQEDLASARLEWEHRQPALAPSWSSGGALPTTRAEAFFELAQFVERMRKEAKTSSVKLNPQERFGFSKYSHAGPEPDDFEKVAVARDATEFLLHALFRSRPQQLLGLSREQVKPMKVKQSSAAADLFERPEGSSLRRNGIVDSLALRVSFVGETVSLREFINVLAAAPGMVVVRSVEVDPAAERLNEATEKESVAEETVSLVRKSVSRFTVVVEFVESAARAQPKEQP